jgi:hypothetical protein
MLQLQWKRLQPQLLLSVSNTLQAREISMAFHFV